MAIGYFTFDGDDTLSAADAAHLDVTGDLEGIALVRLRDVTPAAINVFFAKWDLTGGNKSYWFGFQGNGELRCQISADGSTQTTYDSNVTSAAAEEWWWFRFTFDASENSVTYYESDDPEDTPVGSVNWTAIGGSDRSGSHSIFSSVADLYVGSREGSLHLSGDLGGFWIYDGIGGTEVANPDFRTTDQGDWSSLPQSDDHSNSFDDFEGGAVYTAPSGGTVTLSGSGANAADSTANLTVTETAGPTIGYLNLDGTGYVDTPDKGGLDPGQNLEIIIACQAPDWPPPGTTQNLCGHGDHNIGPGWRFAVFDNGGQLGRALRVWSQGVQYNVFQTPSSAFVSDGEDLWLRVVTNTAADSATFYYSLDDPVSTDPGSVSWTTEATKLFGGVSSLDSPSGDMRVGSADGGGADFVGKIYGVWIDNGNGQLVASPDFRDDDQGWSSPPGVDDSFNANEWTFRGGAEWIIPTSQIAGSGANAGAGSGDLTTIGVQPLTGSGRVASSGSGVMTGGTVVLVAGLYAPGLSFGKGRGAYATGFNVGPGFYLPHPIGREPITLTGSGEAANAGTATLVIVDNVLAGAGSAVSAGYGILSGVEAPIVPVTEIEVIRSDDLTVTIGLDLLDSDLNLIEDISSDFAEGTVTHGNFRRIHSTFRGTVSRPLLWESARLRPYVTLTDRLTSFRWNLGVYLTETARRENAEDPKTFTVEGYDLTVLLDTPVGRTYSIDSNTAYLTAVEELLDEAGVPSHVIDQTKASDVPPAPRTWEISDDNTYLRVVNDLLAELNYRPVYMDREGVLRVEPYQSPAEIGDTFIYDHSLTNTIIEKGATDEQDLWDIPNRWVFIADQPAELDAGELKLPIVGDGLYVVTNQSDGPSSIDQRGRTVSRIYRLRAADQSSLEDQGDAIVEQAKQTARRLIMATGPNPLHWHWDISHITIPSLGISSRWQSVTWEMEMHTGRMSHELRSAA